ncbi:hypothetical protein LTR37_009516 [Vermiconidia calcicola]|uniref:Uncharacterized protein n=1 Tax=Vermiconidia calcicola TaxID=1690605 RepID=A0ACC3N7R0_9PEZI|nr:hypothetical protein LTR37_009516 [Vermiconidia calcicola]
MAPSGNIGALMLAAFLICFGSTAAQQNTCPSGTASAGARCIRRQGRVSLDHYPNNNDNDNLNRHCDYRFYHRHRHSNGYGNSADYDVGRWVSLTAVHQREETY